jgi:dipeptidase E
MIFARSLGRWPEDFDDQEELEMFGLDSISPAVPLFDWFFMGHLGADWMPTDADAWAARGAGRSHQPVWFVDDDSALVVRDPVADPVVVSSGHWRRFGPDGSVVDSR